MCISCKRFQADLPLRSSDTFTKASCISTSCSRNSWKVAWLSACWSRMAYSAARRFDSLNSRNRQTICSASWKLNWLSPPLSRSFTMDFALSARSKLSVFMSGFSSARSCIMPSYSRTPLPWSSSRTHAVNIKGAIANCIFSRACRMSLQKSRYLADTSSSCPGSAVANASFSVRVRARMPKSARAWVRTSPSVSRGPDGVPLRGLRPPWPA
mmetsp:Transcript_10970/g.30649  ORF Transcript_10970/g.30649 Transcript_10970/m.30649 type:complete len:212 (-) Transcript_10970:164-799(-)